jgi:hypothetical protein
MSEGVFLFVKHVSRSIGKRIGYGEKKERSKFDDSVSSFSVVRELEFNILMCLRERIVFHEQSEFLQPFFEISCIKRKCI